MISTMSCHDAHEPLTKTVWRVWARCHQHDIEELQSSFMNIFEFSTTEAWSSFCSVHSASRFGVADLFVFKRDAVPAYEAYPDGCHWVVTFDSIASKQLDTLWFHAIHELIGPEFGYSGLIGMSLSCKINADMETGARLALWASECSTVDVENVGVAFQTFLDVLGRVDRISFVHFGSNVNKVQTDLKTSEEEMAKDTVLPAQDGQESSDLRDTGQRGVCQHRNLMVLVLPGFARGDEVQLVLKNSFIHAVVPCDEPLPAPELQRMRTV